MTLSAASPKPLLRLLPQTQFHTLLDSGDGERLERLGSRTFRRAETQAIWPRSLGDKPWDRADAVYVQQPGRNHGKWHGEGAQESETVRHGELSFAVNPMNSGLTGVFPEQEPVWRMLDQVLAENGGEGTRVLNLFAFTGIPSLIAARHGASITHVDASKPIIENAKENQALSDLPDDSIRWICDDAVKFVQREARRKNQYDIVIVDPPKFGRGVKGEVWDFFADIRDFLNDLGAIISDRPLMVALTSYALRLSPSALARVFDGTLGELFPDYQLCELGFREDASGQFLPQSQCILWAAPPFDVTRLAVN
ncbi:MAG: class I SAM-dependent methyltransferase [Sumerlaeia bacterium]